MFKVISKNNRYFGHFLSVLRHRFFIGLGLSLLVGVLDGIGLAMFLPLLELFDTDREASVEGTSFTLVHDLFSTFSIDVTLGSVLLFILFVFVLKGVFKYAEGYYAMKIQIRFILHIRKLGVERLSNYSFSSFVHADSGRIQNTLSGEASRVINAYTHFFTAIQNGVMVAIYIGLAFTFNSQFSLLVLIGALLTNFVFRAIYRKSKEQSALLTARNNRYHGLLMQSVHYFKYLKATGSVTTFRDKLYEGIDGIEDANRRMGILKALLMAVREPLIFGIIIVVIYLQIVYFGQPIGLIIMSLVFFYRALSFMMILQSSWNGYVSLSGSLLNMYTFLDELDEGKEATGGHVIDRIDSDIRLENVGFGYVGGKTIFKGLSFNFVNRKTTAIVGESGSGKTTLINLLAGLLKHNEGGMTVNGVSYDAIEKRSLQARIGYITQEPVVFDDTLYNNVTFWAAKTPENLVRFEDVMRKAALVDFLNELPQREDTQLGNNGLLISGGQRQRLSIARELFRDIDILIMDEATSALDSETERAIQHNILALHGSYTIVIVAHRLSTVKDADTIVLLKDGEVTDMGRFDELRERSPSFRRMVELQEF
jgi:subfamily B ATP-binding cassette protein MsbA